MKAVSVSLMPLTLTGLLGLCFLGAVWLGAELLSPQALVAALGDGSSTLGAIILHWRIPRVLAAFCVGACLGMAGAVFQGVFRNPLAEPYLLGSASGASVGAAVAILIPVALPTAIGLPVLAFLGAWGATWLVVVIANRAGSHNTHTMILAGVAIAALLTSIRSLLMLVLSDDSISLQAILSWTLGAIQTPHWGELALLAALVAAGFGACLNLARGLDILGMGPDIAANMGLNITSFTNRAVLVAAAITALAVVWGGLVGFIGLIVPHVVRWWIGPRHRGLIIYSALLAGALLMVFDGLARALLPPAEIPLGLLTVLLGVPFFLFILIKEMR